MQRGQALAAELRGTRVDGQRAIVRKLVGRVIVGDDNVEMQVNWPVLCELLGVPVDAMDEDILRLETKARLTRSGRAIRMVQHDGRLIRSTVDLTLVRLIVKARGWWQRLQQERGLTLTRLAANENVTQSYITRVLRLAFLSPDVIKAIMTGNQPCWLDSGSLSGKDSISPDWEHQRQDLLLGRVF